MGELSKCNNRFDFETPPTLLAFDKLLGTSQGYEKLHSKSPSHLLLNTSLDFIHELTQAWVFQPA